MFKKEMFCKKCLNDYSGRRPLCYSCTMEKKEADKKANKDWKKKNAKR
jgi:hypothetical protein